MPETNATSKAQEPEYDAGHVPMTEELDDARHSLPNMAPVLIALVIIAVVIGVAAFFLRSKPMANGTIENVLAMSDAELGLRLLLGELPGQATKRGENDAV